MAPLAQPRDRSARVQSAHFAGRADGANKDVRRGGSYETRKGGSPVSIVTILIIIILVLVVLYLLRRVF